MNKDKVFLEGNVIGRAADTLGYQGLLVQLENLDVVEIDKNLVHKKIDELQLIKLKDVIARIKDFDSGTQIVWLDAILNELGSDYGILKYKTGYEQGRFEGEYVGQQLKDADKVRQELNKPVVKQFVADWYEEHKDDFEYNVWDWISSKDEPEKIQSEFAFWVNDVENNPIQTLVNMHQFGYEVEKEKRYYVRFKNMESNDFNYLNFIKFQHAWVLSSIKLDKKFRTEHTKKQLEEAGFGWVFNCPGIEIEEVEE